MHEEEKFQWQELPLLEIFGYPSEEKVRVALDRRHFCCSDLHHILEAMMISALLL